MKRVLESEDRVSRVRVGRGRIRDAASGTRVRRKRIEHDLRVEGERYRQIVETTHEGIWMADLHGLTTFVNPQMARMLGTRPEQMIGRPVFDFVFESDHATVREHFAQFLQPSGDQEVEERLRREDGAEIWALVAASVVRDGRGQPTGFLGMFTETTARHRAEQILYEAHEQLETRVRERTAALESSHRALAESEEKFRRLFETISDAVLVF